MNFEYICLEDLENKVSSKIKDTNNEIQTYEKEIEKLQKEIKKIQKKINHLEKINDARYGLDRIKLKGKTMDQIDIYIELANLHDRKPKPEHVLLPLWKKLY